MSFFDDMDEAADFWQGYDSSGPSSPKASYTHLEYQPATIPTVKPQIPTITVIPIYDAPAPTTQRQPELEDPYWSQYASVQGTADSTIPSPRLSDGRKPEMDSWGRPSLTPDQTEDSNDFENMKPTAVLRRDPYIAGAPGVDEEFADAPFGRGFDDAFASKEDIVLAPPTPGLGLVVEENDVVNSPISSPASSATSEAGLSYEDSIRELFALWRAANSERTERQFIELVTRVVHSEP